MMKWILLLLFSASAAAFEIPKGTHNIAQLEEAVKKAARERQPLAFVIAKKTMTAT